ncbi:hypothetical protein [Couchioplanes azureus]|nr:hypothetical protein [Couchioplanes caeruleus]
MTWLPVRVTVPWWASPMVTPAGRSNSSFQPVTAALVGLLMTYLSTE